MSSPTQIAGFLLDQILTVTQNYANSASAKMIGIIAPVAGSLLIIYVLLWGAAMAAGQIQEPFTDGAKRIIRITAIVAFALTVGVYQGSISNFAFSVPSQIATQLESAMPSPKSNTCVYTPDPSETALASALDSAASEGFCLGSKAWDKADWHHIGMYLVAVITDISTAILVAVAAGILFVTYVALAVLLAVGPLFILFAIFTQTQRFFETWLGHVVNFMITFILIGCALGIIFAIFDSYLDTIFADYTGPDVLMDCLKLSGMVVAMVMVVLQVKHMASALGGGVALGAAGVGGRLAAAGRGWRSGARAALTGSSHTPIGTPGSGRQALDHYKAAGKALAAPVTAPLNLARRVFGSSNSVSRS